MGRLSEPRRRRFISPLLGGAGRRAPMAETEAYRLRPLRRDEIVRRENRVSGEARFEELLEALPAAIYTTDANGRITFFNQAAETLSGRTPRLGIDQWCVTWRLYRPDGRPLPHDECPM